MNTERPTPRTDAEANDGWSGDAICVSDDFARTLERELAEAREELARLKEQPQPLPRPDKPGWWWCWDDDDEEWVCHQIGSITWAWSGLWFPATPPPAPEKGVEG